MQANQLWIKFYLHGITGIICVNGLKSQMGNCSLQKYNCGGRIGLLAFCKRKKKKLIWDWINVQGETLIKPPELFLLCPIGFP